MSRTLSTSALFFSMLLGLFWSLSAQAAATPDWVEVTQHSINVFSFTTHVVGAGTLAMGIGFLGSACLKYKYHRDNPSQMPLSVPITLFVLSFVLLIFTLFIMISKEYVYGEDGGKTKVFEQMLHTSTTKAVNNDKHSKVDDTTNFIDPLIYRS